jgi:Protein of unknown function (DUF1688)
MVRSMKHYEFLLASDNDFSHPSAEGLAKISVEKTAAAFQVTDSNPMVGLEGRTSLLINLSHALKASPNFFGDEGRPGNMVGANYLAISFHKPLKSST